MRTWKAAALLFALAGCGEDEPITADMQFTDAHNYSYEGELLSTEGHLQAGADCTLSWDQLTVDMRGRAVDPTAVDEVSMVALNLTIPEILDAVGTNELKQSDVLLYYVFENDEGHTSALLSEFSILGNEFDPAADFIEREGAVWTWLVSLWVIAPDGRHEILSSAFLVPDDASQDTTFAFTNDTATFVFAPDLTTPEHLRTAAGLDAYTVDWSAVTSDAAGHAFDDQEGDRLVLGHVDGDVAMVEAEFPRIYDLATAVYRLDVYGETSADLMEATTLDAVSFPGFTAGGTWLLGVECTRHPGCPSPAPLILTVVDVEE